jgi:hypothetical protein
VENPGFEDDRVPDEFSYTRTTPIGWRFSSTSGAVGITRYEKVVVSTTDGRFHRVPGQAVFLLSGALRQTTSVFPRENHDYVLTVRVVLDGVLASDGVSLRLEVNGAVLAEQSYTAATINAKAGKGSSVKVVPLEVHFSARMDVPQAIEIVIDTMGSVDAESQALMFDDVRLCERNNGCAAVYPRCDVAKTDYVALIDLSGSIDHAVLTVEQAVSGVSQLYDAAHTLSPGTVEIRVAAYAFGGGDLQAETGPTTLSTASDLVQVVAGIRAMLGRRRPGQPTAIGAAMVGLAGKAWFQSAATAKIVVLYSDGDPDRIEDDTAFGIRLQVFKSSMTPPGFDNTAPVCLYSIRSADQAIASNGNARLQAFHTAGSTLSGDGMSPCRWNVATMDSTGSNIADPVGFWWQRKQDSWTLNPDKVFTDTLREVVVPRQPCAANPPGCSCDYLRTIGTEECCESECFPGTTFTTTMTTSATSTPTTTETTTTVTTTPITTATSTGTTTGTTQLPHCGCDECIACDAAIKCTAAGLVNGDFEAGHTAANAADLSVVGVPLGWNIIDGPLTSSLILYADKFFGSSEHGPRAGHAGYIAQGGLEQASTLTVVASHIYNLKVTLVTDAFHTFAGCRISLTDGPSPTGKVLATAEYPSTMYTQEQLRVGVEVEIGFTARKAGTGKIHVIVERLYSGNAFGESALVMFDDVQLCVQSNQCLPNFPACAAMDVHVVAMVDVSGSISRKQTMLRQAVETLGSIYAESKAYSPVAPVVRAAIFIFQKGYAVQVWPPAVTPADGLAHPAPSAVLTDTNVAEINATFSNFWVLQHVGDLYALAGATSIAGAMSSLQMVAAEGGALFPKKHGFGAVALFSDGDPFQEEEDDDAFDRGMKQFQANTAWISPTETCLFSVFEAGYSGPTNRPRLQQFGGYSSAACLAVGSGTALRTFSTGTAAASTMFNVDAARNQQCLQGPAHGLCQCDQQLVELEECCEEMCYPETTFTTTPTTSTTPTTTATTTQTSVTVTTTITTTATTTPTTTILPQCGCGECIECDRKPDCNFAEILNANFELDRVSDGQQINGKVPGGWTVIGSGASATTRRDGTPTTSNIGAHNMELFLSAGTVQQTLDRGSIVPLPQGGETYVLSASVSVEIGHIFQGGTLSLFSGTTLLASRTLDRGYIGANANNLISEARMTATIEVSATPATDLSDPFTLQLEVPQSTTLQDMTLFDNIQLCKRTNACSPRYPQCERANVNLVLLVDVSGSIGNVQGSLVKATGIIDALYENMHKDPPPPGIDRDQIKDIKVSLFVFHSGAAQAILLRQPLVNSSYAIIRQRVELSAQNVPLNAATTIGEAVKSLTVLAEFDALWREGADMTSIILVSDGDPEKYTENMQTFTSKMESFQAYVETKCADGKWLCDSGSQCIARDRVCDSQAYIDCEDGSDESERHCGSGAPIGGDGGASAGNGTATTAAPSACGASEWQCFWDRGGAGGECIQSYFRCDGYNDCTDSSDENPTMCATLAAAALSDDPLLAVCQSRGTQVHMCGSSDPSISGPPCIPTSLVCDGVLDCGDGSDETPTLCPDPPTTSAAATQTPTVPPQQQFCQQRNSPVFMCTSSVSVFSALPCIPGTFLCDGIEDCMDGSDESAGVCTPEAQAPVVETSTYTTCFGKTGSDQKDCWCGDNCHTCSMQDGEMYACKVCKNAHFLLNDRCLTDESECTKWTSAQGTFAVQGQGKFGRTCERTYDSTNTCEGKISSQGLDCWCGKGCHMCAYTHGDVWGTMPAVAGECHSCKNSLALHEGKCIEQAECSTLGLTVTGKGKFGLECAAHTVAAEPTGKTTVCTGKKVSAYYLEEDANQDGKTACWCGGNCHQCFYRPFAKKSEYTCTQCKNGHTLFNGKCVSRAACQAAAPGNMVEGTGKFGLVCNADSSSEDLAVPKGLICEGNVLAGSGGFCSCDMLVVPSGAPLSGCDACAFNADGSGARCIVCSTPLFAAGFGGCITEDECIVSGGTPTTNLNGGSSCISRR